MSSDVATNVLGTIGTVLWSVQLIPQVWKNYRRHGVDGLSMFLFIMWIIAAEFYGPYAIIQHLNIPIQIQPQSWCFFCIIVVVQVLHYDHGWDTCKCIWAVCGSSAVLGGIQVGFVFALREHPSDWSIKVFGALAAVFIFVGLLPPYLDIWRQHRVRGFSWLFLAIDMLGALFSILSMAVSSTGIDSLALATYLAVIVGEGGYVCAQAYFLLEKKFILPKVILPQST